MKLVEDNSAVIEQREKEIQHIVSSIVDLNQIFQDLSALIVEQVRWNISLFSEIRPLHKGRGWVRGGGPWLVCPGSARQLLPYSSRLS